MPQADPTLLAYHIIWTTYGTWLPGDIRGWIKANYNGVQSPNRKLEDECRQRMTEDAIELSDSQRKLVEETIRRHCEIRNWPLHAANVRTNHVHVVVAAELEPDDVMDQLKAWCSRKLSDDAGLTKPVAKKAGRRRWFTEGGDKEKIEDQLYLQNAIKYVL